MWSFINMGQTFECDGSLKGDIEILRILSVWQITFM
jgi:hypothetical protein